MNDLTKNLLLWVVVAIVLMVVFQSFSPKLAATASPSYSQYRDQVDNGNGQKVTVSGNERSNTSKIEYPLKGGETLGVQRAMGTGFLAQGVISGEGKGRLGAEALMARMRGAPTTPAQDVGFEVIARASTRALS